MKVLYDSQAFRQKYGGVSKSFCELISNLPENIEWEIAIKQSNNIHLLQKNIVAHLKSNNLCFDNFITKNNFKGKQRLYNLCNYLFPKLPTQEHINRQYEKEVLKHGNFDIFHPTYFSDYYLPYLGGKPFVLTIHDMMPELFPQYFKSNDIQIVNKKKLAQKASAFIAVSEKTKEDAIRLLGINPNKVFVIYHGGPQYDGRNIDIPIIQGKYILYVGQRNAYKNFNQFIQGFALFTQRFDDIKLVCTGSPFSYTEKKLIKQFNITSKVIHYFAKDDELPNLYSHAILFAYPSLYEGFGMPILEAYTYGCPVLLSHCSCFPEIAGDSAIYYNTEIGVKDLVQKLTEIYLYTPEQRQTLIMAGYQRLSLYSWEKSARKLAEVYEYVLSKNQTSK